MGKTHWKRVGQDGTGCGKAWHTTGDSAQVTCRNCLDYLANLEGRDTDTKMQAALAVIVLTPHIAAYLAANDPMALKQAKTALGMVTIDEARATA